MKLQPQNWIGIVGGGQLGRMLSLAASGLGLNTHIFTPEPWCPAGKVAQQLTVAEDYDYNALQKFSEDLSVVTYEFENVSIKTIEFLRERLPVFPVPAALEVSQNRLKEKEFFRSLSIPVTDFWPISEKEELQKVEQQEAVFPAILKTNRFGYDGKGQQKLSSADELVAGWKALNQKPCILERQIAFEREAAQLVARGQNGEMLFYNLIETQHVDGVLHRAILPGEFAKKTIATARKYAGQIAEKLDYVGVLAVEFFVLSNGDLLTNEMAPRVHNSGHVTVEACFTGQFEQHIRAVAGLPLGDPSCRADSWEMINLLGNDGLELAEHMQNPKTQLTLYGKETAKPRRKMGHLCRPIDRNRSEA